MANCAHPRTRNEDDGDYRVLVCDDCGRELARTLKGPDLED